MEEIAEWGPFSLICGKLSTPLTTTIFYGK
jgi:hypothetical protein